MTSEQLRDELARVAEAAPEVRVPDDLYARGRRATARARALTAVAAAACVALLAAVAAPFLVPDQVTPADGDSLGVPDRIHAVPEYLDPETDDLAVGRAAAAFVNEWGVPAVIGAETGEYHLLDLPDTRDAMAPFRLGSPEVPMALSPDGRQLAWAWADLGPEHRRSGVRIADLTTGRVRTVPLERDHGIAVFQLAWSPGGEWLAWAGYQAAMWSPRTYEPQGHVGGVIGEDDESRATWELPGDDATTQRSADGSTVISPGDPSREIAVSDTGRLASVVGQTLWLDGNSEEFEINNDERIRGLWFQGERVFAVQSVTDHSEVPVVRELPRGGFHPVLSLIQRPRALGAIGPRQVLLHQPSDVDQDDFPPAVEIATWTDEADSREIITVEPGAYALTLATELVDPERPTVTRPEPDWPWSPERKVAVLGGGAAGAVLLLLLGWLVRRRMRQ